MKNAVLNDQDAEALMNAEQQHVEKKLPGVICKRCGATLASYADKCDAALDQLCPGFNAIEKTKRQFWDAHYGIRP